MTVDEELEHIKRKRIFRHGQYKIFKEVSDQLEAELITGRRDL
jgi:hypothetical protein